MIEPSNVGWSSASNPLPDAMNLIGETKENASIW